MFQFQLLRLLSCLSETVSFLKTFGYLYDAFETGEKGASVKKVTLRDANEDVDKVCIRYKKLLTTQVENLYAVSHFTQHKTFSALNYAQDFGRVKESLKRTTNSKWATLTKSRIVPCQILSCHCFCINWLPKSPKIMAQFCCLRLFFPAVCCNGLQGLKLRPAQEPLANNKIQDTYSHSVNPRSTWLIQIMKVTKKVAWD